MIFSFSRNLSFFDKTATRNINYSSGHNALSSSNLRNGPRSIDVRFSSFLFPLFLTTI